MSLKETIDVLYNGCYGPFCLSLEAVALYNIRKNDDDDDYNEWINRHDPILVGIYNELKNKFGGEYTRIKIKKIPIKYKCYYNIAEYDGREYITIDTVTYDKDMIQKQIETVLTGNMTDSEKIIELKKLILDK